MSEFDVPQRFHKQGYRKGVKTAHKVLRHLVCNKCKKIINKELEKLEKQWK